MKGKIIGASVVIALAVALGVFGGQAGWSAYQEHRAAAAADAASAAAAAEAKTIRGQQRATVAAQMNIPASAVFRNDRASKKNPEFWCGEVRGSNLLGQDLGYTRYTALLKIVGDEVLWADVGFEERSPLGDTARQASERVAYQWGVYCADQ